MRAHQHTGYTEVGSADELRGLLGEPNQRAVNRARPRLHEYDKQWLTISPYCVLATSDVHGRCTASGRGDPAGHLFHVLDDTTIALPERPGNKRGDSLFNILSNPRVGIISLVPGSTSVLLVNGRGRVLRDAPFFEAMTLRGHRPKLALLVEVEEVTYNCPKSLIRSGLWQPESWQPEVLPSLATLIKAVEAPPQTVQELEDHYAPQNYSKRLY
ncbi:MSMEG_1061 family FMN-dependent PPOX-type flavoprotein [Streptomyces sp. NBC_00989]|uniref:MSMEG_1061 family FMN-dependent PPOX-type flavoprotein n=1 Tax=Streptomyces sp. NBC_00989 TaxID=2903705 RepID=UPI00386CF030|nr:pyridoxamine 5'-phosphate oxidase family protein [Streptomyces sp. NBC_00989]